MLASKVTFAPQLRGTLASARSPRRDQAYREGRQRRVRAHLVREHVSGASRRCARRPSPARPPSRTRHAPPLPPIFFSAEPHTPQKPRDSGLAHPQPGHAAQVFAPIGEGGGRSILEVRLQEPPCALVGLGGSARAPLRTQRSPFACRPGIALDGREATPKVRAISMVGIPRSLA